MTYQNILDYIGNTPVIHLSKSFPNSLVLAKLEGQNPGGSVKDRVALYMIEQAEKRGELTKNKTILEATSGNMGIALAMIGAYKGYKVKIVMSEGMSLERRAMLKALGAELTLTDKKLGTLGAIEHAKKLVKNEPEKYWFSNQFNNPDNSEAHYHGISQEILKQVPNIEHLILGSGTSGTAMGIIKRFQEESPNTKITVVFPTSGYQIQGIQNPDEDFHGDILNKKIITNSIVVRPKDAYKTAREAGSQEGLFIGMSSGAILFAAKQIVVSNPKGPIVCLLADRGEKYLSTKLFESTEI